MKRYFLLVLVLLLLGGGLGLAILRDPGYVLISWRLTSVEMSFWLAAFVWALSLLVAGVAVDLVFKVVGLPGWLDQWRQARRLRRSLDAFARGSQLGELGEWRKAERLLFQAARLSPEPLPAFLAAARAAARQHAYDRAEKYLVLAEEKANRRAVEIARARLLLTAGQWEVAAGLLRRLHDDRTSDESVSKLLVEALARLQKWGELADLLPTLMRQKGSKDDPDFARLEKRANVEILGWIALSGSRVDKDFTLRRLHDYWQALPKRLRAEDDILAAYAGQLIRIGADDEAEALLAAALEKQWSNAAVELYGRARSTRPDAAVARAEGWKRQHPHNPGLMLTLGRLCLQNRRWADAKLYFETSLSLRKSTDAYAEMIRLLSQSGDREANRYVIEGLAHMAAKLPELPLP